MKANRKTSHEDAVSPVIAVILMVAITVVLAATVYLWVSGFGNQSRRLVDASFAARAIDLPWTNADTDTYDDAIELTLASADHDGVASDIALSFDGQLLTWNAANHMFLVGGTSGNGKVCTTSPGGDANDNWERGASVILVKPAAATADTAVCDASITGVGQLVSLKGVHSVRVSISGQGVLDANVEVHDDGTV